MIFIFKSNRLLNLQVAKPTKKFSKPTLLTDKVATQASVYSFMWTLTVIKKMKLQVRVYPLKVSIRTVPNTYTLL